MNYDLIVIGGGPAGYWGAERAGHAGLKTLLIEARSLGGVCLNEGCIPSKALLHSAKIYDYARFGEKYGINAGELILDHGTVMARKNKVVKVLVAGIRSRLKAGQVDVVEGQARIVCSTEEGYAVKVNNDTFTGKRLLIATGSVPVIPPVPGVREGLERGYVLTSREILDIEKVPGSLVIVGGGIIGLEMASYFNSAGSKVTVIEMLDRIGGSIDKEISQILLKNYQKRGIDFKLNSKVVEVCEGTVVYEHQGKREVVEAEKVLISVGRKPSVEGLGLENIGVEVENGAIKTDDGGRTGVPGVYAAGDVNGRYMLAHAAYREAEVCVNNMLGRIDAVRYDAIPSVIYTNPEVASVGETEESATRKGIEFEAARVSMRYSGRYVAENEGGDGICKVLIDKKHRNVLGIHMIGSYSSEIIYGAGMMIAAKMRVRDIKEMVFPHPTVSEVIKECIFQFED